MLGFLALSGSLCCTDTFELPEGHLSAVSATSWWALHHPLVSARGELGRFWVPLPVGVVGVPVAVPYPSWLGGLHARVPLPNPGTMRVPQPVCVLVTRVLGARLCAWFRGPSGASCGNFFSVLF